jgi:hypothetical protein
MTDLSPRQTWTIRCTDSVVRRLIIGENQTIILIEIEHTQANTVRKVLIAIQPESHTQQYFNHRI